MSSNEAEETFKRLAAYPGVQGKLVVELSNFFNRLVT